VPLSLCPSHLVQVFWISEKIGKIDYPSGDSYEGEFSFVFREGKGVLRYANGDVFEGDFRRDVRHGYGVMTYHQPAPDPFTGDLVLKYEGNWANDAYHGTGTATYKDGSYTGVCNKRGRKGVLPHSHAHLLKQCWLRQGFYWHGHQ